MCAHPFASVTSILICVSSRRALGSRGSRNPSPAAPPNVTPRCLTRQCSSGKPRVCLVNAVAGDGPYRERAQVASERCLANARARSRYHAAASGFNQISGQAALPEGDHQQILAISIAIGTVADSVAWSAASNDVYSLNPPTPVAICRRPNPRLRRPSGLRRGVALPVDTGHTRL
jgi:hypothetical protein